jgi:site-specific recombinase XerD
MTARSPAKVVAPRALGETIDAYLEQISVSLRPSSVASAAGILRRFERFVADFDPAVVSAADLRRRHVEGYKSWLAAQPGRKATSAGKAAPATVRQRLTMLRMFFERIIEWGWDDSPPRQLIFAGDIPKRDEALPKFLDDPTFAAFMRAARAETRPLTRLVVELLARTGMRVGELCTLEADAVVIIGSTHWLRIPLGKLHNDRYIPLHPHLVAMLTEWHDTNAADPGGRLLVNEWGRPLNRHAVARMMDRVAKAAGIEHVNPHRMRHTLATQAINRGMSLEAIAALLGHRSLDMTQTYAKIANRTVADEYFAVSARVEALYDQPRHLPADAEGPAMARLRRENRRMLGNGYCTRPPELDCAFESICESCTYFETGLEFHPVLLRQRDDAAVKGQVGRQQLFDKLLATTQTPTSIPKKTGKADGGSRGPL